MPFGTGTVVTNVGKAIIAARMYGATPTQTEPKYLEMGVGATGAARTAAAGDTALSSAVETRTSGTGSSVTTIVTNDTHQITGTITATGSRSVDEAGVFDAAAAGNMYASATFPVISLSALDGIAFTWQIKFA